MPRQIVDEESGSVSFDFKSHKFDPKTGAGVLTNGYVAHYIGNSVFYTDSKGVYNADGSDFHGDLETLRKNANKISVHKINPAFDPATADAIVKAEMNEKKEALVAQQTPVVERKPIA